MGYLQLLRQNPRSIGFGFLQAFFSGLGQTHFISLCTPMIMASFSLSATEYGSLYSLITLVSGFAIVFIGPSIDHYDARYFSVGIGLGLLVSLFLLVPMSNIYVVSAALFGLRLFGQGLSSSLSSITVARYFDLGRGKALSLSQLGYPIYEGLVTPASAFLLTLFDFWVFILIFAASVVFIYLPLGFGLTRSLPKFNKNPVLGSSTKSATPGKSRSWSRKDVFSHWQVYFLIPQVLMPPFALTGLFFHQALIADLKSWSLPLMASGLFFFALGRIFNTFITGPLVDQLSATKLFPFYQLPLSVGFLLLGWMHSTWAPALCFLLFGLTVGSGGPIKSAIWAELYGVRHLGAIKSMFATLMIFSTAASPVLFGWVLDHSQTAKPLLYTLCLSSFVFAGLSYLGLWGLKEKA